MKLHDVIENLVSHGLTFYRVNIEKYQCVLHPTKIMGTVSVNGICEGVNERLPLYKKPGPIDNILV